jgi:putative ABC transport system substrate-binding protein
MRRREFIGIAGGAAAWPLAVRAQQRQMRVIGVLYGGPATETNPFNTLSIAALARGSIAALERGLKETGYANGENVKIEYSVSMDDLIRDKAEVIIVTAGASIRQAQSATTSIPLIMNIVSDPVSAGLVTSLNRPGGNITGVSLLSSELMPKRLQMLRELIPQAKTCAVLINPRIPDIEVATRAALQTAAGGMGIALDIVSAQAESEFEPAFEKIGALKSDALLVTTDPLFTRNRDSLVALAARYAVPTSYPWREFVLAGGLISYAPSLVEAYHELGIYAGKILNGAKAADLPIEQPAKFELAINLRTANALGLTVPQSLLARADEVIE